jgi:hypothetical protein
LQESRQIHTGYHALPARLLVFVPIREESVKKLTPPMVFILVSAACFTIAALASADVLFKEATAWALGGVAAYVLSKGV